MNLEENVKDYVEKNIGDFHQKRIESLDNLNLQKILKRKNPYLFKVKNTSTVEQIVRGILDAHISSSEETIFGDWLEGLAIFINHKIYGGRKSGIRGIDLEFEKDNKKYIVSIKSSKNWGNSSQVDKLQADFKSAKKTLRTSNSRLEIIAVNGCCYGQDNRPDKGDYFKYCGQTFWYFISNNKNLYCDIIEPLGYKAKEKNEAFEQLYSSVVNRFTKEFIEEFCKENGEIDWQKITAFNSKDKNIL